MTDEHKISQELAREGDIIDFMREGQAAYNVLNPGTEEDGYETVEAIKIGGQDESPVEEVYPGAADDMEAYRWDMGEGQEDEYFVLDEESRSVDEENMFSSRVIHGRNARYQLVKEKEDGNHRMDLEVTGDPMFGVENPNDFERLWSEIQGRDSEIGTDSRLDSDYAPQSEYFRED